MILTVLKKDKLIENISLYILISNWHITQQQRLDQKLH